MGAILAWFASSRIGRALSWAAGALAAVWLAWVAGKRQGQSQANSDRLEGNAKAAKQSKDIRYEAETSDDQHLVDILTGRRKL